jgi:hypothetical protein
LSRLVVYGFFIIFVHNYSAQNIVENSTFKFLNIPGSARHNYLGKAAIASTGPYIDLALANPALLEFNSKDKLLASSSLYFTSNYGHVAYSLNNYKFDIPYVVGINFINYGKQKNIDIYGNELGTFTPTEMSAYIAASKTYEHYKFGMTMKFAYGDYFYAKIGGIAVDMSMIYRDDEREIFATLLLKNVGYQFIGVKTNSNPMPFDIQLAMSKKLKHMPLRFTFAVQELYHWNTATTTVEGFGYGNWPQNNLYQLEKPGIFSSIMSHFIFGAELNFGKTVKIGANYDVKKGMENKFENLRGLTGLGLGFGVYTRKFDLGYSLSKFGPIGANHTFTLTMNIKEWMRK